MGVALGQARGERILPDSSEMYLEQLIGDPVMRTKMGKQAYFYVTENYDARANSEIWGNAITEIMEGVCY